MDIVTLAMGSGGRLSAELIDTVFLRIYGNPVLNSLDDAAELDLGGMRLAFTTDSYTVKPVFFPGGDIGKLSICGTVNDLTAKGARPGAISAGFIIEEGFPMDMLKKIVVSMHETASSVGVLVVTGDTKVVGKGQADGIFINTSGIGTILPGMNISCRNAKKGDDIIITGAIAEHGIAIFNAREGIEFSPPVQSDVAALNPVLEVIAGLGGSIHVLRDPTRGGVASALNEIAGASRVNIRIFEKCLPITKQVRSCCDIMGIDPLYMANEGKLVIFTDPGSTQDALRLLRQVNLSAGAAVIGKVDATEYVDHMPPVYLETVIGSKRFVPLAEGELLPRIC